jgi:MFS transporter, DHA2 family, multidrug resistance protein
MWESISPTNNASGLFKLIRTEGSSIGVAVTTTLLQRHTQVHQMRLIEHVTPLNPLANEALRRLGQLAGPGDPVAAAHRGLNLLYLRCSGRRCCCRTWTCSGCSPWRRWW